MPPLFGFVRLAGLTCIKRSNQLAVQPDGRARNVAVDQIGGFDAGIVVTTRRNLDENYQTAIGFGEPDLVLNHVLKVGGLCSVSHPLK